MKLITVILALSVIVGFCDPPIKIPDLSVTNFAPVVFVTNNTVMANGKVIGYVNGTNYVPVPDVHGLSSAHETGFALGVRYGAAADRRNPDLNDLSALIQIAKAIMQVDPNKPK